MARALMVKNPFGGYAKGDVISNPDTIAELEANGDAANCTPFNQPDEPTEGEA